MSTSYNGYLSTNDEYLIGTSETKLEHFFDWCVSPSILDKTKFSTAISYDVKQKERMMNVLKGGRLVISNNLAERGIKTLVIGKKRCCI